MTRRDWIALASAGLAADWPAILKAQQQGAFGYFKPDMAADVEALAAQILPSEAGSSGAREAGVIYFIDHALATFDKDKQDGYHAGMAEIQELRKEMFPGSESIASLSAAQQLQLMKAIEQKPFFELLRMHTVMGFLCDPSLGGNRGEAGWKRIGFEDKFHFQPPFGYYDQA